MSEAVKQCSRCGEVKRISMFHKNARAKDGHSDCCRDCWSVYQKQRKTGEFKPTPPKIDPKLVLKRAISTFGKEHQLQKIAEECAEFLQAYLHYRDARQGAYEAMVDELADLFVTAWQGRLIVGPRNLDAAIDRKLNKLLAAIERHEDDLR